MRPSVVTVLAVLALSAGSAAADDAFHPVPAAPGQGGPLELKVDSFGNGVHGEMQVEVHNPGSAPAIFYVSGLYFVPDPNEEEAPQRMGIIGGIRTGLEEAPRVGVSVPAGATRKLRFDVYCVDRWRHAPSSLTTYSLAPTRMPAKLIAALDAETKPLVGGTFGSPDEMLADRIQDLVWETRHRVHARLAGEK
ncbi:MAG TPA: hypothetical protein VHE35_14390 [Kofleriaceae bacterium]|nr:hypothetical protein [Kofleriaceae bacterium]